MLKLFRTIFIFMDTFAQPKSRIFSYQCNNLFEYLLVATSNEEINEQVQAEKNSFFDTYGAIVSVKTKPYITVTKFLAKEAMEETIIRWMNRAIGTQPRFSVLLNNYGGFPPHTIYMKVQQQQPFKQLFDALQSVNHYVQSNDCPPMQLVTKPHLAIAKQLSLPVFNMAIQDYAKKSFSASFDIGELVLLRRQHEFDDCKQLTRFQLSSS